ncbi:MAG: hypothetical protein WCZ71_03555 [Proteiniphilum sp.]|jgi:hypothetical protein
MIQLKMSPINSFQELAITECVEISGGGVSPLGALLRCSGGLIGAAYWLGYLVEKNNSK